MSFYYPVRNAIWDTVKYEWYWLGFICFLGEACSLGYTAFLTVLIRHLKDPDSTVKDGIWKGCIAGFLILMSVGFRKEYTIGGKRAAISLRKTLLAVIYNKIEKLSTKSLTETNSGKLITIVSGDILGIERALTIAPIVFATPFLNLGTYILLGFTSGWLYAGIAFVIWLIIMLLQHYSSSLTKYYKSRESKCSD